MSVLVKDALSGSPAKKAGIESGDRIIAVNGNEIMDVLDYRFYQNEKRLKVEIQTADGKLKTVKIHKGEYEDLGLEFETYLMDKQKTCKNKCIFCFIDQLPKGMRESLYFKDDDSRLSFLFGNYITLTNLSEHETERIIKMHISPVNISVHTTNPELRSKMMNNRFAGESLKVLERFNEAGIQMNCQLVLCPGINDGQELARSLDDLACFENVKSVAAVPVGLTKYREGLFPLKPFSKKGAEEVIGIIEAKGEEMKQKTGERRFFAADEFYLLAEKEMPAVEFYEDFPQLENGVGCWALTLDGAIYEIENSEEKCDGVKMTAVTGAAAYPLIKLISDKVSEKWKNADCKVVAVENDFFGHGITVSGLVTGADIVNQLKGRVNGNVLLIPEVMLRYENDMFLDSMTVKELEDKLNVEVITVSSDGAEIVRSMIGKAGGENG